MRLKELLRKYIYALLNKIIFQNSVTFSSAFGKTPMVPMNLAPFAPASDAPSMKNASLTLITVPSEKTLTWLEIAKRHIAVFPHQLQVFQNITPRTTSVVKISE